MNMPNPRDSRMAADLMPPAAKAADAHLDLRDRG